MRPELSQPRQVGALFGGHHDEPDPALAVLDEQVLAMQARDFVVPGAALLDGKDGRVLYGAMLDAQLIQQGEELLRVGGHVELGPWHPEGEARFLKRGDGVKGSTVCAGDLRRNE